MYIQNKHWKTGSWSNWRSVMLPTFFLYMNRHNCCANSPIINPQFRWFTSSKLWFATVIFKLTTQNPMVDDQILHWNCNLGLSLGMQHLGDNLMDNLRILRRHRGQNLRPSKTRGELTVVGPWVSIQKNFCFPRVSSEDASESKPEMAGPRCSHQNSW